jgi:chromosome segregation ATPase
MSATELTKEQLLDYVRKQKIKIKKLESDIAALKESSNSTNVSMIHHQDDTLLDVSFAGANHHQSQIQSLEKENNQLQQNIKTLQSDLTQKDAEIENLNQTLASRCSEIDSLRAAHASSLKESKIATTDKLGEIDRLNLLIRGLKAELQEDKMSHAVKLQTLQDELSEVHLRFEEQTIELQRSRELLDVKEKEMETLHDRLEQMQDKASDGGEELNRLQLQIEEYAKKEKIYVANEEHLQSNVIQFRGNLFSNLQPWFYFNC